MASPQQSTQTISWRGRVRVWLQDVEQHRQMYGVDLHSAATNNRAMFPRNSALLLASEVIPALAKWLVKSALKDASTQLGLGLTDEAIDAVAAVVISSL